MQHFVTDLVPAFLPIIIFGVLLFYVFKFQGKRQKPLIDQNFQLLKERNELLREINGNLSEISSHLKDLKTKAG